MATQQPVQQQSIQMFYKPTQGQPGYDVNNPQAVYDTNGNLVSLQQYKQATGQTDTPDNEVDWSAVQSGIPSGGFKSNTIFDPNQLPGLAPIWGQLTATEQAFIKNAFGNVSGQYNSGGAASADINTWNDALQRLSTDPSIQAQYGDAATMGAKDLQVQLGQITGNYNADLAAQQAQAQKQQQDLQNQMTSVGTALSGYNKQAQQQLAASQNQIVQSTRSQYQSQLQNLGRQYESTFGSAALGQQPQLSVGSGGNQLSYQPTGGVIGTNTQAQQQAEASLAAQQGSLPSVTSSGALSNSGSK